MNFLPGVKFETCFDVLLGIIEFIYVVELLNENWFLFVQIVDKGVMLDGDLKVIAKSVRAWCIDFILPSCFDEGLRFTTVELDEL